MKEHAPLDRRQFFQYLRLRATTPEAFTSELMMRIDQLPAYDRAIVETFRPSWKMGTHVELSGTEVRVGEQAWGIEADVSEFLAAIDGKRTIGELLVHTKESVGLYDRCIRILAVLLKAGALDLDVSKTMSPAHPQGELML
jgi:hypothetical protein